MANNDQDNEPIDMLTDPYYFRPLYSIYRSLILLIGTWPAEIIEGRDFLERTRDHDAVRKLVMWNFIAQATESEIAEYESGLSIMDFGVPYKITSQAREFAKLELNNVSELDRAILILLRADSAPEQRMGLSTVSVLRVIGFYELVMLLDKSESAIRNAIARLQSRGFINARLVLDEKGRVWKSASEIEITDSGLLHIGREGNAMTLNNIHITNSYV